MDNTVSMEHKSLLSSGAEAIIYRDGNSVVKSRIAKAYRHPDIDSRLRRSRTKRETKILGSLSASGIVPRLLHASEYDISMEYLEGAQLKSLLDLDPKLASAIGMNLAMLHNADIIHGDLTTSNMILGKAKLYFIDFGLSFVSKKIEDKAVDIHLFRQALESKHFRVFDEAYSHFIDAYDAREKKNILKRLEEVEKRGRYKPKI